MCWKLCLQRPLLIFSISLAPSGSAGTGWGSSGAAAGTIGDRRGDGATLDLCVGSVGFVRDGEEQ